MPKTVDGIILIAKQSGITSFSSLWQIKNALGTKKIGHTGTLDTFADGLLVALSGKLTRLVSCITDCDKEYLASILFGTETDTLDPDGTPVKTGPLPLYSDLSSVLPYFCGPIMQIPPSFSALHVDGQRASDRIRKGESVEIPARPVTIFSIDILSAFPCDGGSLADNSRIARLDLRVRCSKGTYIRSLARDIAQAAGSVASLGNLRRTRIGPFSLEDAAGSSMLPVFGTTIPASYGKGDKPPQVPPEEIIEKMRPFTRNLAEITGLPPVGLCPDKACSFSHGQLPEKSWFIPESSGTLDTSPSGLRYSVFCGDRFAGVISAFPDRISYDFVVGDDE